MVKNSEQIFIINETLVLFDGDYEEEVNNNLCDELEEKAERLIEKNGWENVFPVWNDYLHTKCTTPESVLNYANHFYVYYGCEYLVPEPYKFLGYMYYILDLNPMKYKGASIMDTLAIEILNKAGYKYANWDAYNTPPYYIPEEDPKVIAEVEKLRQENKK